MTLHFLHIGKTGGTAVKRALGRAGRAYWWEHDDTEVPPTPYGKIALHHHGVRLADLPAGDFAFFFLRDPVSRFVSAFYSRLNEGRPYYDYPWSPEERRAFEAFPTPQRLAAALSSGDARERDLAHWAMRQIRHMNPAHRIIGRPAALLRRLDRVVYIGRQETLTADWHQLRLRLDLPPTVRLPRDTRRAHRQDPSLDRELPDEAVRALREWYAGDLRLLEFCERVRARRRWGIEPEQIPQQRRRLSDAWPPLWVTARTHPRLPSR
jgi:hypothetical protein